MNKYPNVQIRKIESYSLPALQEAVAIFLENAPHSKINRPKRVLLKPNLLGAFSPEKAVTTHPVVMEALVRHFLDLGKEVWIGDSPGGILKAESVWETCGMKDLAERYPVKLVNLSTAGFRELEYEGVSVKISEVFWQCGIVINVAKYKTHSLMAFTGGLKNLYGLIPGLAKTDYHRMYPTTGDFARLLLALYALTKSRVTYSFIDGIIGMDGPGPSAGRVRNFGLLLGSTSISALDHIAARLMGFGLEDVPYLVPALHQDGVLPSRVRIPTSFRDFKMQDVDINMAKLAKNLLKYIPGAAQKLFRNLYDKAPVISGRCKKCGICVENCPVQAISPASPSKFPRIDPAKCIKCMCCHELCPYQAIDIERKLLARLVLK